MRIKVASVLIVFLVTVFSACNDESEQLTQYDIIRSELLKSTWEIQLFSEEFQQTTCNNTYSLQFSLNQCMLLINDTIERGSWDMRMINPIIFYDELGPLPEDESNIQFWNDSDDLQLELILQLNNSERKGISGRWIVCGYSDDAIYLKNKDFCLLFTR